MIKTIEKYYRIESFYIVSALYDKLIGNKIVLGWLDCDETNC